MRFLALRSLCLPAAAMLLATPALRAQGDPGPQPPVVDPGGPGKAPSDATVLFDGRDLSGWTTQDGSPARCSAANGEMVCRTGSGDVYSKETFSSAQIHLEFNVPHMPGQKGQLRGNSGVYLQACYEVQILDSFENPTYANGALGAVYGFSAPKVNAARRPGEWQTYDILFHPPKCGPDGKIREPGNVTVLLNGVLVQENVKLDKAGGGCTHRNLCQPGPLRLQDHSGFEGAPDTTMRFRNIWIRKVQ
jgi:hypothetical protein